MIASNWTVANAVCPSLARTSGDTTVTEGSVRNPGERLVDPADHLGSIDAPGGAEHNQGVVAGLGREALGQKGLGLLGLPDASEIVLEAGPDRGGQGDDRDDADDPSEENRSSVVVALPPDAAQHVGTALRSRFTAMIDF